MPTRQVKNLDELIARSEILPIIRGDEDLLNRIATLLTRQGWLSYASKITLLSSPRQQIAVMIMCKLLTSALTILMSARITVTFANTISLTESQRLELSRLVGSDPEVKKLFGKVRRDADAALNEPGRPISKLSSAGRLATDPLKHGTLASLGDMRKLTALADAYLVTSNPAYRAAAKRIILGWARVNQPTGIPIDETKLEPLFIAYDVTRAAFGKEERMAVDDWLRRIADAELHSIRANSVTASNNWNSHRLKILGLVGFLLEDKKLVQQAVQGFQRQIQTNLAADGSSFDFQERDALRYHCYDLEPLLTLCIAAHQNGIELYHYQAPSGASLSEAVNFLVPYCTGEKSHAEWLLSRVKFDRRRAAAGEEGFSPGVNFNPRNARTAFVLASFFDERYFALARTLFNQSARKYPNWQSVLIKIRKAQ